MKVIARYASYYEFKLPRGVTLLNEEENNKAEDKTPFSWWIKWNVLNYYDKNGQLQRIEAGDEECDMKRPDEAYLEDDDEEDNE